jgi:PTH1 family peptidyl-tRNA hydrolase
MRLIVGLGNPGERYRFSRHNVGFRCLDLLAKRWEILTKERRAKAVLGQGFYSGQEVVLAKPRTFMNNSGEGIEYLLTRFRAQPQDLVIIYDEMELPLGRLRIRAKGSDGGHNGMKSIISELGTQDFPRIRVGIGPPADGESSIPHVLGSFAGDEEIVVAKAVDRVLASVEHIIEEGIDAAMSQFNQQE